MAQRILGFLGELEDWDTEGEVGPADELDWRLVACRVVSGCFALVHGWGLFWVNLCAWVLALALVR